MTVKRLLDLPGLFLKIVYLNLSQGDSEKEAIWHHRLTQGDYKKKLYAWHYRLKLFVISDGFVVSVGAVWPPLKIV